MRQPSPKNAPAQPKPAAELPVLIKAINLTSRSIEARARLFRTLVMAVGLVSVASIVTALVSWRVWPLAGLVLVIPMSGGFLLLDGRLVGRWKTGVLGMKEEHQLDVDLFLRTISQFKHFPTNTLRSMLATLTAHKPIDACTPGAASSGDSAGGQADVWKLAANTATLTVALTAFAVALSWPSPWLLLIGAGAAGLFVYLRRT
jgi:hypothetical protein